MFKVMKQHREKRGSNSDIYEDLAGQKVEEIQGLGSEKERSRRQGDNQDGTGY